MWWLVLVNLADVDGWTLKSVNQGGGAIRIYTCFAD